MSLGRAVLLILGLLGAVALWKLLPVYDTFGSLHVAADRQSLIERTRHLGRDWGCPVVSDSPLVDSKFNRNFAWVPTSRGEVGRDP